jgi:hypothetical protein
MEEPMPIPASPASDHDAAVRLMTAWPTWAAMQADLKAHNASYAPTIRNDDNAAPAPEHKAAITLIREAVNAEGFRWYDGSRLHNDPAVDAMRARYPKRFAAEVA